MYIQLWYLRFSCIAISVLINSLTDDLSVNKPAQQSKTFNNDPMFAATNVVDGDINTCTRKGDIGTTSSVKSTWWYVDLGDIHSVYNIRIQFKDYADFSKYPSLQNRFYVKSTSLRSGF